MGHGQQTGPIPSLLIGRIGGIWEASMVSFAEPIRTWKWDEQEWPTDCPISDFQVSLVQHMVIRRLSPQHTSVTIAGGPPSDWFKYCFELIGDHQSDGWPPGWSFRYQTKEFVPSGKDTGSMYIEVDMGYDWPELWWFWWNEHYLVRRDFRNYAVIKPETAEEIDPSWSIRPDGQVCDGFAYHHNVFVNLRGITQVMSYPP